MRIAIADDEADMRQFMEESLTRAGHEVVASVSNGKDLVTKARETRPELLLTDIRMPEMDGIDAAAECFKENPVPIILISAHHESDLVKRAASEHIMGYLVKPIRTAHLDPMITVACQRFVQYQELEQEARQLKRKLEERKLIERAKGVIMSRASLDEPTAYRHLQKTASARNVKLIELARTIVTAEEAYRTAAIVEAHLHTGEAT